MKRVYAALSILSLTCAPLMAQQPQNQELLNLGLTARVDYQRLWNDGDVNNSLSGFEGKYLFLRADGKISDNFSYSWRQRFNTAINKSKFFNSTDWLYVKYTYRGWSFSGGKEVVAIGGFEYDANPSDIYAASLYWMNCAPFKFGASVGYNLTANDKLSFQIAESMFNTPEYENMYTYSLHYGASHGIWSTLSSVNMMEYAPGRFINYIMLGNKIDNGTVALEFDFMNRASSHQTFLFRDCSVIADLTVRPSQKFALKGKMTYDVNRTQSPADLCVLPGTELTMAGGGIEFSPIVAQKHALRLHANCFYAWGTNTNSGDVMQNKTLVFDLGVKFAIDLLSIARK